MKLALGSDHAGFWLKEEIKTQLKDKGNDIIDVGTSDEDSVDYPDFSFEVAKAVAEKRADKGILICGSGIGVSIAANKVKGIRAANVNTEEQAKLSRLHNDANVLCLGSRFVPSEQAKGIVKIWLETEFEGGRHQIRIDKISKIEGK